MTRINQLFENKSKNILSIYFTAGYPKVEDTTTIIKALAEAGADLLEIGIPFSDPLADGPTIQGSGQKALENGMSLKLLFEQLQHIRNEVDIPLILMGYLNPIYQFGMEAFCQKCAEVGIDGLIIPDLPLQEYLDIYQPLFAQYQLQNIFLITPQTSEKRIRLIDEQTNAFIYMVAASSITGAKKDIQSGQVEYFNRINDLNLKNPRLIGFGISNHETYKKACQYANGVIIGSAFIKSLGQKGDLKSIINNFVASIREEKVMVQRE